MSAHESYVEAGKIAGPSDRKFGLTLGGLFLALAAIRWWLGSSSLLWQTLVTLGAVLMFLGAAAPGALAWPNRAWMKLGTVMAAVMTPLVMLAIFGLVFIPMALVMRLRGRDQLGLGRKPVGASYWVERLPPGPSPETMIHQF